MGKCKKGHEDSKYGESGMFLCRFCDCSDRVDPCFKCFTYDKRLPKHFVSVKQFINHFAKVQGLSISEGEEMERMEKLIGSSLFNMTLTKELGSHIAADISRILYNINIQTSLVPPSIGKNLTSFSGTTVSRSFDFKVNL